MKQIKILFAMLMIAMLAACSNPNMPSVESEPQTPVQQKPSDTPSDTPSDVPSDVPPAEEEPSDTPTEETPINPWILVVKDSSAGTRGNAGTDFVYIDETVANPFAALVNAGTVQLELVGKRELKTSSNKWYGTSATDKISVVNQYKVYVHKDAVNSEYFLEDTSLKYYLTTSNNNYAFRYRIVKESDVWKMSVVHHNSLGANDMPLYIVKNSYSVKNN